jgi:tRNA (guanine37-N1)-methyltransferase
MRSLAVTVPLDQAETVRRSLRSEGLLRSDLKVARGPTGVSFPVASSPGTLIPGSTVDEREFEALPSVPRSYRDLLPWSPELIAELPRAFDVVGEVVLIRLPKGLEEHSHEIGEALLRFVPRARVVGWDQGVHGVERRRTIVPLAGKGDLRTMHQENGIRFEIDLSAAYFSPRLAREHARVAAGLRAGDRFADLCCGIGPFSLTAAGTGRARSIVAIDVNPEAIALLERNRDRLGWQGRIDARAVRLEEFLPTADRYDRVVLNLPHEGIKYLTSVGRVLGRNGVLHYYEVTDRSSAERRPLELARLFAEDGRTATVVGQHVVHPYSPVSDLLAFDLRFDGPSGGA